MWFLLSFLLIQPALSQTRQFAKPEVGGAVVCSDVGAVIEEAIAYHLTGAPTTSLPLNCALKMKWKYFNPKLEDRGGEPGDKSPPMTWFRTGRDSYKILSHKKEGEKYQIEVRFTIHGKNLTTKYIYEPWDFYQKKSGVCGFITSDHEPAIHREDCQK